MPRHGAGVAQVMAESEVGSILSSFWVFFSDSDEKHDGCVSVVVTSDNGDQGDEPFPVSGLGSNQWDSKLVVLTAPEYGLAGAE